MIAGLIAAGGVAAVDWWAVATGRRQVESIAKPLVMIVLIATAFAVDADPSSARTLIIGGLTLGLLGDVFLLPQVDRFIEGLAAFLIGHVLYTIALAKMFENIALLALGCGVAAVIIVVMAAPVLRAVRGHKLEIPVTVYMGAVVSVVVLGVATGRWPAAVGAVLFAVSDGLLGADRFVEPAPQRRVFIHGLYHLGQAGLVVGVHQSFS